MRIGTWNLEGRWDQRHLDLITAMDCELLLLTEVSERVELPGYWMHATTALMAPRRHWAAIASRRPLVALPDPHGATALAEVGELRVCSSVLPWRSCGSKAPWIDGSTAEKTEAAVADIEAVSPVIWGGDWNHAAAGREWSGSQQGRRALLAAVDRLGLQLPTADQPHQLDGLLSVDHIAVPTSWQIAEVERHSSLCGDKRISDHDAYCIEIDG